MPPFRQDHPGPESTQRLHSQTTRQPNSPACSALLTSGYISFRHPSTRIARYVLTRIAIKGKSRYQELNPPSVRNNYTSAENPPSASNPTAKPKPPSDPDRPACRTTPPACTIASGCTSFRHPQSARRLRVNPSRLSRPNLMLTQRHRNDALLPTPAPCFGVRQRVPLLHACPYCGN